MNLLDALQPRTITPPAGARVHRMDDINEPDPIPEEDDMSKAAAIRMALAEGPKTSIELQKATGIHDVGPHLLPMLRNHTINRTGEKGSYTYALAPTTDRPAKKDKPAKKAPRKTKQPKKAKERTAADVARKFLSKPSGRLAELARQNYAETRDQLLNAMLENLDGYQEDPVIAPLLAAHERAKAMVEAL